MSGYKNEEERLRFRPHVYSNVLDNMTTLLDAAEKFHQEEQEANRLEKAALYELSDANKVNPKIFFVLQKKKLQNENLVYYQSFFKIFIN